MKRVKRSVQIVEDFEGDWVTIRPARKTGPLAMVRRDQLKPLPAMEGAA